MFFLQLSSWLYYTVVVVTRVQSVVVLLFKKNLNAPKPSEHPPSGEKMSKGLGGNIGLLFKEKSERT